jgi:phage terminase large subunit-like protein
MTAKTKKPEAAVNYILEYYQKLKNGTETAGRWVLAAYEMLVKGLQAKEFFFDAKKARRAIRFIENFCHHCEGRDDLLKLELWQKAAVSAIFGIVDASGLRQFREVFIVIARKNGKSLLAAAIAAYMTYADGEYGARVFCVAPKLDQAEQVYNAFYETIKKEPELMQLTKKRKTDVYIEGTASTVKKIAFNAKKSDGFNPSLVICDEVAAWQGDAGLKQYEVLKSGMGARRQPLLLSISTAGYVNDGAYDELYTRSTAVLNGGSKERRLLPLLYVIDDVEKWNDINELAKSNPNLGVSVTVDYLLEEIAIAEQSLPKKTEFLVKYCNIKQNSAQAWLSASDVKRVRGPAIKPEMFRGHYCVGGIDLSQTTDLTSACLVIERGGRLFAIWHFWMPAEKLEESKARDQVPYDKYIERGWLTLAGDNFVDYKAVFEWFRSAVKNYKLMPLQIGYDRYSSQYLVQDLQAAGFHCDDVYQGFNLSGVIKEAEGLIKDECLMVGDNELAVAHLLDTAVEADNRNNRLRIKKVNTQVHIDGTAALLCALTVRQKWHKEYAAQLANAKHGAIDY